MLYIKGNRINNMRKLIKAGLLAAGLFASSQAFSATCYEEPEGWATGTGMYDRSELIEEVGDFHDSITPGQAVLQCATFALAAGPTQVWNNTCNCAKAVRDLCSWSPRRGMRASGGASVSACMVFLPFLR
jgi:hypothetical protein